MKLRSGLNVCKLPKLIIISGPTASGKTSLAIDVAHQVNGAIISADSMQVYKGLDIGTAKVSLNEMAGIPHYLLDVVYPNTPYSVADFQRDGRAAIKHITEQGKVPIIVGGTGLYIQSLVFDYVFDTIESLDYQRYDAYSTAFLAEALAHVDPRSYERIDGANRRRIVHALALAEQTNETKSMREARGKEEPLYDFLAFALMPERVQLYERINERVDQMMDAGLIAETQYFKAKFELAPQIKQAIGYRETLAYDDGVYVDRAACAAAIAQNTRRFAKRQITWLKNQRITYQFFPSQSEVTTLERYMIKFFKK